MPSGSLEDGGSIFDQGSNFKFQVGAGDVIKGMDQSVMGMKVGGERTVRIPPSLGYGKRGSGPEIPPSSTLIFEFLLQSID
jgi:FKBP-type peptidyl-prolyl cis-trans isomerase